MMKSESTDAFTTGVKKDDESVTYNDESFTATENFSMNGNYKFPIKKYGLNEKVAAFCSSWKFIALMSTILVIWVIFSLIWWYRQ